MDDTEDTKLESRVGKLETGQELLSRDVKSVAATVDRLASTVVEFRRDWSNKNDEDLRARQEATSAKALGIKDYVVMISAAVGVITFFVGGVNYLVQSSAASLSLQLQSQVLQITERLNGQNISINSTREDAIQIAKASGEVRIQLGELNDQVQTMRKRWDAWDAKDWQAVNATQTADIASNKLRLEQLEREREKDRERTMDKLLKP